MSEIKINKNHTIEFETDLNCTLCSNKGKELYKGLEDDLFKVAGQWTLMSCECCELIWLLEQPNPDQIYKLYKNYHTHDDPNVKFTKGVKKVKWILRKWILSSSNNYSGGKFTKFLGFLLNLIPGVSYDTQKAILWTGGPEGNLLDVGCGNGIFLKKMQLLGWRPNGVEFDPNSVKQAVNLGLNVTTGSVEDGNFKDNQFDLITLNHVIEHLPNPVSTLRECYRILKPKGRLMMVTPNINSYGHKLFKKAWRGLEVPRHLNIFSVKSLSVVVTRAGFTQLKAKTLTRSAYYMYIHSLEIKNKQDGAEVRPAAQIKKEAKQFKDHQGSALESSQAGEELHIIAIK